MKSLTFTACRNAAIRQLQRLAQDDITVFTSEGALIFRETDGTEYAPIGIDPTMYGEMYRIVRALETLPRFTSH